MLKMLTCNEDVSLVDEFFWDPQVVGAALRRRSVPIPLTANAFARVSRFLGAAAESRGELPVRPERARSGLLCQLATARAAGMSAIPIASSIRFRIGNLIYLIGGPSAQVVS